MVEIERSHLENRVTLGSLIDTLTTKRYIKIVDLDNEVVDFLGYTFQLLEDKLLFNLIKHKEVFKQYNKNDILVIEV